MRNKTKADQSFVDDSRNHKMVLVYSEPRNHKFNSILIQTEVFVC